MKIEKAVTGDFHQVCPLLQEFNNPKISKEQWKNLFSDYWNFQGSHCGYKLMDGSNIVGFVAYIFSRKRINGKWEKFCNLSSWIVKKEYRSSSIDLLYPLRDLSDQQGGRRSGDRLRPGRTRRRLLSRASTG